MIGFNSNIILSFVVATLILVAFIVFIITFALLFQKKQLKHLQEKAFIKTQFEQEILKSQLEVQNQALHYFGQELHDNIGQLLTVLKINISTLEYGLSSNESTNLPESVQELNEVVDLIIHEVRGLSKSLDSNVIQEFGLQESLAYELQRIGKTKSFQTEIQLAGTPYRLDAQREVVLFRIAQEILNNAMKHSQATQLTVLLNYQPGNLELLIHDNGKGFDVEKAWQTNQLAQSGLGLRSIKNRTSLLGGQCLLEAKIGQGTRVCITVPVQ